MIRCEMETLYIMVMCKVMCVFFPVVPVTHWEYSHRVPYTTAWRLDCSGLQTAEGRFKKWRLHDRYITLCNTESPKDHQWHQSGRPHSLFSLTPYGKWYRSIQSHAADSRDSFFPQEVTMMNCVHTGTCTLTLCVSYHTILWISSHLFLALCAQDGSESARQVWKNVFQNIFTLAGDKLASVRIDTEFVEC